MTRYRTRRDVLAASPAVAAAALAGVSALALARTEDGDAAFLRLGREWSACRQRLSQHQDRFDAAMTQPAGEQRHSAYETFAAAETALYADLFDVEGCIIATPAMTLAGLHLKARVVARDHDESQGTDLASIERMLDDPDTEGRAALSLAADILRLGRIA